MFRNNTNIIGFLQKKAFFNRTPSPSPNSRFSTNPGSQQNKNVTPPKSIKYESNKSNVKTIPINKTLFSLNKQQHSRVDTQVPLKSKENVGSAGEPKVRETSRQFQSSRVEVKMCIQQLSNKISVQLRLLQGAITELTVSLQSIFYKKLSQLKQQLLQTIDEVFTQARNNLNNLVTNSNEKHLKKILKSKHQLAQSEIKVKELRSLLESNWRKAAGEMFVNNFDQKIENLLEESQLIRKGLDFRSDENILFKEQSALWQTIRKNVQGLIQRRSR